MLDMASPGAHKGISLNTSAYIGDKTVEEEGQTLLYAFAPQPLHAVGLFPILRYTPTNL